MEIERKFKLNHIPTDLPIKSKKKILQGYLAVVENGAEIRIRKYGRSYSETVKTSGMLVRNEIEIKLTKNQFDSLWPLTKGQRIEKIRFTYTLGALLLEVDVYSGELKGLIIAEVEFTSVMESSNFTPPVWFDIEVTNNTEFKNKNLAG